MTKKHWAALVLLIAGFLVTVATSPPPCESDKDCGEGQVCRAGDCVPADSAPARKSPPAEPEKKTGPGQ